MRFGQCKNSGIEGVGISRGTALAAAAGGIKKLSLAIALLVLLGSPSLSGAATYYVSPNGNDANSGTSDAQAWKTIAKVNSFKFAAGDDIYFKCGGTWSGTALQPNVQGASDINRTVIGAYYGAGTIGVSINKPIIDGKDRTVPTNGSYSGLIEFSSKSYVTIENLQVQGSGGLGISFNKGSYNIVRNCSIFNTYRHGIRFSSDANNCICEYNEVTDTGYSRYDSPYWPAGIMVVGDYPSLFATHNTIRYNKVYLNHGEGIDIIKGANTNTVEYNTVINNRSADIYVSNSAKDNIVRYNLIYGYAGAPWSATTGISIDDEKWFNYAGTEGNKIYGNLVANCRLGIHLGTQHTESILKDTEVYNNTLVDNEYGIHIGDAGPYENSFVKNNIIWCTGERSSCKQDYVPASHNGLAFDYNLWSSQPTTGARGNNDPPYAAPLLAKQTGWKSLMLGSLTGREFALTSGSPAIGAGSKTAPPYNELLNPDGMDFGRNQYQLTDQNAHGAWEIGATVFTTSAKVTISPPSQFQLVISP